MACLEPVTAVPEIDRGRAGASAAREWTRRHEARKVRVRSKYGRLSGVVLALSDDPHSTAAWAYGANGESTLGALLDPLCDEGMAVLHDRRIPGSRANIDHIVIGPRGVTIVDAKNYKGRVERRDVGGFFSVDERLYVGGRDKTSLVRGMAKQKTVVREVVGDAIPVTEAICFVDSDWSLFARPFQLGAVHVLWPRALGKLLRAEGPFDAARISSLERTLALALPGK